VRTITSGSEVPSEDIICGAQDGRNPTCDLRMLKEPVLLRRTAGRVKVTLTLDHAVCTTATFSHPGSWVRNIWRHQGLYMRPCQGPREPHGGSIMAEQKWKRPHLR
jgi:hypothetical protein